MWPTRSTHLLLLIMAGLFVQTLGHARTADPGFGMRHGILASIDLLPGGYGADRGRRAFYRDVLDRLRTVPGVRAASFAESVPLSFNSSDTFPEIESWGCARRWDLRP